MMGTRRKARSRTTRDDVRTIREMPMRPFSPRTPRTVTPLRALVLLLVPLLAGGCSYLLGARTEPPRLYVLSVTQADGTHALPPTTVLGFGPVDLPAYLDRRGLVQRIDPNRIEESRTDLWAEPLGAGFRTTVEQNLRLRLPGVPIRAFPWPIANQPDLAVSVEVSRFERTPGDAVELNARFAVRDPRAGTVLADRDVVLVEPVTVANPESAVAAMSRAAGALSDRIAAEVAQQADARPARRRDAAR
jgi:uncharacterized lipoprotein YmbA